MKHRHNSGAFSSTSVTVASQSAASFQEEPYLTPCHLNPYTEVITHVLCACCKDVGQILSASLSEPSPRTLSTRFPLKNLSYFYCWTIPQEKLTRLTDWDGHVTGVVHSNTNRQSIITLICHGKFCSAGVLQNPWLPVLQEAKILFWPLLSCVQSSSEH